MSRSVPHPRRSNLSTTASRLAPATAKWHTPTSLHLDPPGPKIRMRRGFGPSLSLAGPMALSGSHLRARYAL
jgi:hypothetical protein